MLLYVVMQMENNLHVCVFADDVIVFMTGCLLVRLTPLKTTLRGKKKITLPSSHDTALHLFVKTEKWSNSAMRNLPASHQISRQTHNESVSACVLFKVLLPAWASPFQPHGLFYTSASRISQIRAGVVWNHPGVFYASSQVESDAETWWCHLFRAFPWYESTLIWIQENIFSLTRHLQLVVLWKDEKKNTIHILTKMFFRSTKHLSWSEIKFLACFLIDNRW